MPGRTRLALLLCVVVLAGCAPRVQAATAGHDRRADLQSLVDQWRQRVPVPAVSVAVDMPGSARWLAAGGTATADGADRVRPDARFRTGSTTKTFVATVVLQLVEEGALRLGDPLERFVPAVPAAADITVRDLLGHTSGIPDYVQAAGLNDRLLDAPDEIWSVDDVLALVADRDREFEPGSGWSYSNTNYVLLGEVIRSVTGQTWADEVTRRIIEPLGLTDTVIPHGATATHVIPGSIDVDGDGFSDVVATDPWPALESTEGPAGAMVSTAADLATFAGALFRGDLVAPSSLAQMVEKNPFGARHAGYGLGVEITEPDFATTVWGHGGSMPGYRAAMWYVPDHDIVIVVLTNEYRSNPSDLAELLLRRITRDRGTD